MPLYEYKCAKCSHRIEVIQKFSDPPPTKCPKCKGRLEKLFSAPAIQFKGAGWYVTDYGKKGGAEPGTPSGKPGSAKDSKPEGGSEPGSKPAADGKGSKGKGEGGA